MYKSIKGRKSSNIVRDLALFVLVHSSGMWIAGFHMLLSKDNYSKLWPSLMVVLYTVLACFKIMYVNNITAFVSNFIPG